MGPYVLDASGDGDVDGGDGDVDCGDGDVDGDTGDDSDDDGGEITPRQSVSIIQN